MKPDINKYIALKTALLNEKVKLEDRLSEISKAIGEDDSVPSPAPSTSSISLPPPVPFVPFVPTDCPLRSVVTTGTGSF